MDEDMANNRRLTAAPIFGNGMVLQQGEPIPVWGKADANALVAVTIQGKHVQTKADARGHWRVTLPPLDVSVCEQMTLTAGAEQLIFRDVAVGEVWLCGGQSNMEMPMEYDAEYDAEKEVCADALLRFYDCPEICCKDDEKRDYSDFRIWRRCDGDNLRYFSAVAYYFGKELRKRGVPVGLIGCNWGGTKITSWMPQENARQYGGGAILDRFRAALEGQDVEALTARYRADPGTDRSRMFASPRCLGEFIPIPREMQMQLMQTLPQPEPMPVLPCAPNWPGALYRHMLAPVAPYALRGYIYYQGESDADDAALYESLFEGLIRCWRETWGGDKPFLAVQLAPFEEWLACTGANYETVRQAQARVADRVPGVYLASAGDLGEQFDIHPKHKRPFGERLAWLARRHVYGENSPADAPKLKDAKREDSRVTLRFAFVKEWQWDGTADWLEVTEGQRPVPFTPALSEGALTITLPPETGEVTVHGAWMPYYHITLKNENGLPIMPFTVTV